MLTPTRHDAHVQHNQLSSHRRRLALAEDSFPLANCSELPTTEASRMTGDTSTELLTHSDKWRRRLLLTAHSRIWLTPPGKWRE